MVEGLMQLWASKAVSTLPPYKEVFQWVLRQEAAEYIRRYPVARDILDGSGFGPDDRAGGGDAA